MDEFRVAPLYPKAPRDWDSHTVTRSARGTQQMSARRLTWFGRG
jgi:hypothetical protein